jgi:hypothetical protein
MRSFLLKVNGKAHCSSGISRPKAGDWQTREIVQLPKKGTVLPRRGGGKSPVDIEQGDTLWIWTHETKLHGGGVGLAARAIAAGDANGKDYVELADVYVLPRQIGKETYQRLSTRVEALDYTLGDATGEKSRNGFNHHGAYLLTAEDHENLVALVREREEIFFEQSRSFDEEQWRAALAKRDTSVTANVDRARRQSFARPGQSKFRRKVLDLYGRKCLLTQCSIESAIDAAHVVSHDGDPFWDSERNGIPLRRDLHGMFDDFLWSIDPSTSQIVLSPNLKESLGDDDPYKGLDGTHIAHFIPRPAVEHHFELFSASVSGSG